GRYRDYITITERRSCLGRRALNFEAKEGEGTSSVERTKACGKKRYQKEIKLEPIKPVVKAITTLLLLFAVFHLNELTNFPLSIDAEFDAFRENSGSLWLGQGRWTTYLFEQFVLRQPVLPFLPLALFGLFCSLGYLLFLRAIGEERPDPLSFAFFPL